MKRKKSGGERCKKRGANRRGGKKKVFYPAFYSIMSKRGNRFPSNKTLGMGGNHKRMVSDNILGKHWTHPEEIQGKEFLSEEVETGWWGPMNSLKNSQTILGKRKVR